MKTFSIFSAFLVLLIVGCGKTESNKFVVTGTVTYQGKPLPLGAVMFIPEARGSKAVGAPIDANGHYRLEATPGNYYVQVQMAARLRGSSAPTGEGAGTSTPEVDWLIPEKFSHFESSGLKAVVEPKETNQIDLPMK